MSGQCATKLEQVRSRHSNLSPPIHFIYFYLYESWYFLCTYTNLVMIFIYLYLQWRWTSRSLEDFIRGNRRVRLSVSVCLFLRSSSRLPVAVLLCVPCSCMCIPEFLFLFLYPCSRVLLPVSVFLTVSVFQCFPCSRACTVSVIPYYCMFLVVPVFLCKGCWLCGLLLFYTTANIFHW